MYICIKGPYASPSRQINLRASLLHLLGGRRLPPLISPCERWAAASSMSSSPCPTVTFKLPQLWSFKAKPIIALSPGSTPPLRTRNFQYRPSLGCHVCTLDSITKSGVMIFFFFLPSGARQLEVSVCKHLLWHGSSCPSICVATLCVKLTLPDLGASR